VPKLEDREERAEAAADGVDRLEKWMAEPRFQDSLRHILPQQLNAARFATIALRVVREIPKLAECHPMDVCLSVLQAATLGLEISTMGECWLVPYEDRKAGIVVPQLQIGYLGHLALAWRSEKVAGIQIDVVMPGDDFEYQKGTGSSSFLHHRPQRSREIGPELTHAYMVVRTVYGGEVWDVLTAEDVERIRQSGPAPNSPAWTSWYPEMAMGKTAKRVLKFAPKSREAARAIALDDEADAGKRQSFHLDVPRIAAETGDPAARDLERQMAAAQTKRQEPAPEPEAEPPPEREPVPVRAPEPKRAPAPAATKKKDPRGTVGW
jgi:recombination protein RecT